MHDDLASSFIAANSRIDLEMLEDALRNAKRVSVRFPGRPAGVSREEPAEVR